MGLFLIHQIQTLWFIYTLKMETGLFVHKKLVLLFMCLKHLCLPSNTIINDVCGSYTLPPLSTGNFNVGYYTQAGGNGLINPSDYTISTPGIHTVYLYATATNNTNCYDEKQITFTIHPLLNIDLQDGFICVNPYTNEALTTYTIDTGLNNMLFTVNWYLNNTLIHTGSSFTANQAGTYDVKFIKLTPENGADCNYNDTTVTVTASSAAIASFTVSSALKRTLIFRLMLPEVMVSIVFNCNTQMGPLALFNQVLFFQI